MKTFIGVENINGADFNLYEITTNNQVAIVKERILTQEEIDNQEKQSRLSELAQLIQEAKLLDEPYQTYIDEYKTIKESL